MAPPAVDPRSLLEAYFAEVLLLKRPELRVGLQRTPPGRPWDETGHWFVGADFFEGGFRLRFFGRPHPVEITGVTTATRTAYGWATHGLELRGDILVRRPREPGTLLGFPRKPKVRELRTPVLWMGSPGPLEADEWAEWARKQPSASLEAARENASAPPAGDPRPVIEAFIAEMKALDRLGLHIDTKPEGSWPWSDRARELKQAEFFDDSVRLSFFGPLYLTTITGVRTATRGRHAWGRNALELHGDIVVRSHEKQRPLLGIPRGPKVRELRTPVLWLVSP